MGSIILNFLAKMAFLIGEGSEKDPELAALHGHTLGLLDLALQLFNKTPLKLGEYLIRLLHVSVPRAARLEPDALQGDSASHTCGNVG
jgi:hypothetical protein